MVFGAVGRYRRILHSGVVEIEAAEYRVARRDTPDVDIQLNLVLAVRFHRHGVSREFVSVRRRRARRQSTSSSHRPPRRNTGFCRHW